MCPLLVYDSAGGTTTTIASGSIVDPLILERYVDLGQDGTGVESTSTVGFEFITCGVGYGMLSFGVG